MSQMPRTLASITLSHSSSDCSWMKPGLLTPEATTSWSTRPNLTSAVSSIAWASSSDSGRATSVAGSPPTSRTSSATASSSALEPDTSSTFPPSALSAMAVARPNVPDAPVTMATLPLTSNSDSGLRNGSEIIARTLSLSSRTARRADPGSMYPSGGDQAQPQGYLD